MKFFKPSFLIMCLKYFNCLVLMLLMSVSFVFIVWETSPLLTCSVHSFLVILMENQISFCYLRFLQLWWVKSTFTILLTIRITLYYLLVLILSRLLLLSIINVPIGIHLNIFVSTPLGVKFLTFLLTILQLMFLLL